MAKTCIGLDLGSSSVKMAQVQRSRGGEVKLLAFGIEPVAPDAIVDGTIMNQSAVVDYPVAETAPNDAVVLINVGAAISHINILAGNATAFTRDVNAGGNAFTDELKRQLGVSQEEAEALKLHGDEDAQSDVVQVIR